MSIIEDRRSGMTISELMRKYNTNRPHIRKMLIARGMSPNRITKNTKEL